METNLSPIVLKLHVKPTGLLFFGILKMFCLSSERLLQFWKNVFPSSQKWGKHIIRACFWCTTSYRWLKCRYHVHHLAPQNTSWENTWRPLRGCPGDTFRLKNLNSESRLAPCGTFAEGRSSYFHFGFISITLMKIWCTGREQESHLGIEVRNRLKIYGVCKMKSVVEGLLFFCLGQVCTRAKRWEAWTPLQDCFHSWLWRCL